MRKICLVLSLLSSLFISCGKGNSCVDPLTVSSSSVVITFIDKHSGKYLYTEQNSLYSLDSLKTFDEAGNAIPFLYKLTSTPNSNERYYSVAIQPIYNSQTDQNSFYRELCKKFVIRYKYTEADTIRSCFKSTELECGSTFETLKITYKDTLISSVTSNVTALINIYKS